MDLDALKAEIDSDPLTRGYSGMDDAAVAASLNDTVDRDRNRASMSGSEIWENAVSGDLAALSTDARQEFLGLCSVDGGVDPFGPAAQLVINIFGAGSGTVTALQAARVETVSRGEELGLGTVAVGHVEEARRLP